MLNSQSFKQGHDRRRDDGDGQSGEGKVERAAGPCCWELQPLLYCERPSLIKLPRVYFLAVLVDRASQIPATSNVQIAEQLVVFQG